MYWEPGGPGDRPPASRSEAGIPAWLDDYDLALVVERWLTVDIPDSCLEYVGDAVGGFGPADVSQGRTCAWGEYQYGAADRVEISRALAEKVGGFSGLYAASFGATRAQSDIAAVQATSPRAWVVIESPAPMAGASAADLIDERAAASRIQIIDTPTCSHGEKGCRLRTAAMERFARTPPTAEDEIGNFDRTYMLLSMARDVGANSESLAQLWDGHTIAPETVRSHAYAFTLRFGESMALPDLIGYLAGVCPTYLGWPPESAVDQKSLESVLARLHSVCSDVPANDERSEMFPPGMPVALIVNPDDTVAPWPGQKEWVTRLPQAKVFEFDFAGHGPAPLKIDGKIERWLGSR